MESLRDGKLAIAFHGTRLLTLSACSTAKDYKSRNGFEMDSLGMVAQQKDAEAVLATLWDVNDLSTSHIMSDFYDRWIKNPARGRPRRCARPSLPSCTGSATTGANTGRGLHPSINHRRNFQPWAMPIRTTGRHSFSSATSNSPIPDSVAMRESPHQKPRETMLA